MNTENEDTAQDQETGWTGTVADLLKLPTYVEPEGERERDLLHDANRELEERVLRAIDKIHASVGSLPASRNPHLDGAESNEWLREGRRHVQNAFIVPEPGTVPSGPH